MGQEELFLQIMLGCSRTCSGLVLAGLGHSLQYLLCSPALPRAVSGAWCWHCPGAVGSPVAPEPSTQHLQ